MIKRAVIAVVGLAGSPAYAVETLPPREIYEGVRSLGMSGAFSALADDESALFANPAGIGREDNEKTVIRGVSLPNVVAGWNKTTWKLLDVYLGPTTDRVSQTEQIIREARDATVSWGRLSSFPYITIKRFQIGVLWEAVAEGVVDRYDTPRESSFSTVEEPLTYEAMIRARMHTQTSLACGLSFPWKDTGVTFGVGARYGFRTTLEKTVEVSEAVIRKSSESFLDGVNKTRGFGLDIGALWEPSPRSGFRGGLSFVARNVGNARYEAMSSADVAELERMNLVVGASLFIIGSGRKDPFEWLLTGEGHHLSDTRVEWRDKARFGTEVRVSEALAGLPFSVRAGHNLRGFSFGASLDLLLLRADFASFVVPVDTRNGTVLDRRQVLRLSVDLRK